MANKKGKLATILGEISWIVMSVSIAISVNLVVGLYKVQGESMFPTLQDGDYLIGVKIFTPERGDIVTAKVGNEYIIKRVLAVPGDTIQYNNGIFYLNGSLLDEANVGYEIYDNPEDGNKLYDIPGENPKTLYELLSGNPVTLEENEYFLVGDNRNNSSDSRTFGPLNKKQLVSKIVGK